ncbi:MAG TPA: phosphoribosyltransferase family protein [Acidobacteriota bacterium]|nr:phosphoribosyltransferase family protein [Acidobacteriota bacterium]
MIFESRTHAGILLADKLRKFKKSNAAVYALPRGGVVIGAEIAKALNIPLDLIVSRKIGHPTYPEYAIGAITEHGESAFNYTEVRLVDPQWLQNAIEEQFKEAKRRRKLYMAGKTEILAKDRIAIIVDDGIATGYTMQAAIEDIRKQGPASIVIAVPVVPREKAQFFSAIVDEFIALDIPKTYAGAVGAYYLSFPQLTDEDVIQNLEAVRPVAAKL